MSFKETYRVRCHREGDTFTGIIKPGLLGEFGVMLDPGYAGSPGEKPGPWVGFSLIDSLELIEGVVD